MSKDNMIRAWKDPEYRVTLNAQERALLPPNPAGTIDEGKLAEVVGGTRPITMPIITCFIPCSVLCSYFWTCPV
jgi:mersacidin/lichenicidin family type 2 lantibiotic